jgi:hypothetical protein
MLTMIPVLLGKAFILKVLLNVLELRVVMSFQKTGVVVVLFRANVNGYVQ